MARQLLLAVFVLAHFGLAVVQGQNTLTRPRVPTPASAARDGTSREGGGSVSRSADERYARGSLYSTRPRETRRETRPETGGGGQPIRGPQLAGSSPSAPAELEDNQLEGNRTSSALPSVLKRRPGSVEAMEMPLPAATVSDEVVDGEVGMAADEEFVEEADEAAVEEYVDEVAPSMTSRRELAPPAELPFEGRREVASRPPGGGDRYARSRPMERSVAGEELQISSRTPSIRLDMVGPGAITIGKPARYGVTVFNEGAEAARQLEIRLQLPPHVQLGETAADEGNLRQGDDGTVYWSLPQLTGGSQRELQLILIPQQAHSIDLAMDWSVRPQPVAAEIEVQQPALVVEISGPDDILFGERQLYTITLSNPGTGAADDVTLDVATGGGAQSKKMGTIPAGGMEQIRMELIARESGELEIASVATAEGLRHEAKKRILVRRAELTVEVTAPRLKFAGSNGVYEVLIRNSGNAPAKDVEVSLRKPAGVRYLAGLEDPVESGGRVGWQIAQLDADQQRLYRVEVAFEKAGEVVCEAVVSAADDLTASAAIETQVEAVADLKLAINDPESPQAVGDEVTYEIRVVNRGTKDSGQITVLGHFSDGIEPARAVGAPAELLTGQVVFEPLRSVKAGESILLQVVARGEKAGNHRFRAVLKCEDPEIEVMAEAVTRFFGGEASSPDTERPARVSRSSSSSSTRR